tara:strand:+ start:878 stop:1165 length:288 start_codon:yes stop_codon:yes gene_type:complete
MSVDIKKLTVSTDDQRKGWIDLLDKASQYHFDMAERFKPDLIGLDGEATGTDEDVYRIHTAWSNAISDAISLIEMWEIEEDVKNSMAEQRGMTKE